MSPFGVHGVLIESVTTVDLISNEIGDTGKVSMITRGVTIHSRDET